MPANPLSYSPSFETPGATNSSQLGQRTTIPNCVFDGTSQFGLDAFNFNDSTSGSGTVAFNSGGFARLSCTTASGDNATRQSKPYVPYRVGRTLQAIVGAVMGAKKSNVRQRIGLFDANNGYFFEQDDANLKIVSRTNISGSPVDTAVNQSSWNLDVLDGTGRSGYNIDTSKFQQFVVEYVWGGMTRFGVISNGFYLPCHEVYTENTLTNPGTTTLFLPTRAEITNTGTAASSTNLDLSSMAAFLEDGNEINVLIGNAANSSGRTIASGATVPLISIRLKSAFSRGIILPSGISIAQTGTFRACLVRLVYGGALTGASFSSASNGVEFDVAATIITGGTTLYGSFIQSGSQPDIALPPVPRASSNFSGTADIVSVSVFNITGSSATMLGSINWREAT